jgi:DNA-binding NarL/FixJ family response regulator
MNKTILIVDDHILFAQSLQSLIKSFQDYQILKVLKDGQELVDYFQENHVKPDIVLLDIRMPVMDGIQAMEWMKERQPEQKVLALTMEHEEATIIKMIRLGCRGYLLKDIEPQEFLFALETVYESGYYLNPDIDENLVYHAKSENTEGISDRERQFLSLACTEMTYKEVAAKMNLSPKTIDNYRESLFHKLNVKNRVGLVLYAVKHDFVKV